MKANDLATTNKLLLIIALPVIFYMLDVLSFIFIPFMFSIFIALLFTPMMRWMKKNKFPQYMALGVAVFGLVFTLFIAFKLVQVTGRQIESGKRELFVKLDHKVESLIAPFSEFLGMEKAEGQSAIKNLLQSKKVSEVVMENFQPTFSFVRHTVVNVLMTLFFLILLLAGSLNFKDILQNTLLKGNTRTIKIFIKVENSITEFLKVKFFVSLLTGIGFGIAAWGFGLSFPLFWGLFAFVINFVQMVGSIIATLLASLLAYVEIQSPGVLLSAILVFTGIQVLFGSILEPILMGKSFSINVIVVLIMLMFWGFLLGVPGLILAIPITVLAKTILGEFPSTKKFADLMS
jgi:AI-2 transport protein TqsA